MGRGVGLERVGLFDNFFGLGGDSLSAAQVFTQIEQKLGQRRPLATLFQAPTVEQLAQVLESDEASTPWSPLVPIQPAGKRPAFYLVHAHGGNVVGFYELAKRLGPDQPFYGLQARGLDGGTLESRQIEEMAADYIREIRREQPSGPYYLGGWCMGGVISYEMGRQLREMGEEVPLVAMIQASHPDYPLVRSDAGWARPLLRVVDRLDLELSALSEVKADSKLDYLQERAGQIGEKIKVKAEKGLREPLASLNINLNQSESYKLERLERVHTEALRRYQPRPYDGRVVIIRAGKQPRGIVPDETLGWTNLLQGEVHNHSVPGHQRGMLDEPRVAIVADYLQKYLGEK